MRFRSGRLVEVFSKTFASGVWRCAQVVADNGDGYTVRYCRSPDNFKESIDKVSAESVRPCPPLENSLVWTIGDIAEVLDGGYWKVSVIEEDLGENCYQIRVIGSLDEFRARRSNIRMRQEWKDNKWVSFGKGSENCEDLMMRVRKKARMQQQGGFTNVQPTAENSSKSLKRPFSDITSTDEGYSECLQKRRAVNKETVLDSYSFIGKEDSRVNLKDIQSIYDDARLIASTSQSNDCVSDISSVASCSVVDPLSDRVLSHTSTSCSQDDDSFCSDAESSKFLGDEEGNSFGECQDAIKTHELDLHTYRCFLEALYVSGPMSWEQEILLTNTRMKLCVSNDEHLRELKRLNCIRGSALRCH